MKQEKKGIKVVGVAGALYRPRRNDQNDPEFRRHNAGVWGGFSHFLPLRNSGGGGGGPVVVVVVGASMAVVAVVVAVVVVVVLMCCESRTNRTYTVRNQPCNDVSKESSSVDGSSC